MTVCILSHAYAIVDLCIAHPPTRQHLCESTPWKPHIDSIWKATQRPICKDDRNNFRELLGLMRGCNAADGPTIDSDLSFDFDSVYQKLHNSLRVHFLLYDGVIR